MRDWHAERYAAGERLAKAARVTAKRVRSLGLFISTREIVELDELDAALAEYEASKDFPLSLIVKEPSQSRRGRGGL